MQGDAAWNKDQMEGAHRQLCADRGRRGGNRPRSQHEDHRVVDVLVLPCPCPCWGVRRELGCEMLLAAGPAGSVHNKSVLDYVLVAVDVRLGAGPVHRRCPLEVQASAL